MAVLLAAIASAGTWAAGEATAATVSTNYDGVVFQAAPGEHNVVTVRHDSAYSFLLEDSGAPLEARDDCKPAGDEVRCPGYALRLYAGDGDDTVTADLNGDAGYIVIHGDDGDDTLTGTSVTEIYGDAGNDSLVATSVQGVHGGDGNDTLHVARPWGVTGGGGDDHIELTSCSTCSAGYPGVDAGDGNDVVIGSPDPEVLNGGNGDDVVSGGGGRDQLTGGDGKDTLLLADLPTRSDSAYVEPGWTNYDPDGRADGGTGDDQVVGGAGGEILDGGDGNDTIEAGAGIDTVSGGPGDDTLHGGDGVDTLDGGQGRDVVDGGDGIDGVDLSDSTKAVTIDLTTPGGDGAPGDNDWYLPSVEWFTLTDGNDRFVAGKAPVRVMAGLGNDKIIGGPGNDTMQGDSGPIPPEAAAGKDTLIGGGGNDALDGGPGDDTLRGGPGNDTLFAGGSLVRYGDTRTRYSNHDRIFGGPGGDGITGGWRVHAGPGDDDIHVADFAATNRSPVIPLGHDGDVSCGSGRDRVSGDYYDDIGIDCETVWNGYSPWKSIRPDSTGAVTLIVRCAWDFGRPCKGIATLLPSEAKTVEQPAFPITPGREFKPSPVCHLPAGRETLATHRFRIRTGRVDRVVLRLTPAARRSLSRAGCMPVAARLRATDPAGDARQATRMLTLRAHR